MATIPTSPRRCASSRRRVRRRAGLRWGCCAGRAACMRHALHAASGSCVIEPSSPWCTCYHPIPNYPWLVICLPSLSLPALPWRREDHAGRRRQAGRALQLHPDRAWQARGGRQPGEAAGRHGGWVPDRCRALGGRAGQAQRGRHSAAPRAAASLLCGSCESCKVHAMHRACIACLSCLSLLLLCSAGALRCVPWGTGG